MRGDVTAVRVLVERAAVAGDIRAQRLLGTALAFEPNGYLEGLRLLRAAADAGDGHAAHNLAVALRMGAPHVPPRPEEANSYFEIAVASGFEQSVATDPTWWRRRPDAGSLIRRHATGNERFTTFFLNVDLDLESTDDLNPLVLALDPRAFSLERQPGRASFELNVPVLPADPEPLIREFVSVVQELPPEARALWDRCSRRVLDIGIQSASRPVQETYRLTPATLRMASDIGAEIALTVYAMLPDDDAG
jgi:hypothetical protein